MPRVEHMPPTPSTDKVLVFIRSEVASGREFPTHRQIADHMGWKGTPGVRDTLSRLKCRGDLSRFETAGRNGRMKFSYRLPDQTGATSP